MHLLAQRGTAPLPAFYALSECWKAANAHAQRHRIGSIGGSSSGWSRRPPPAGRRQASCTRRIRIGAGYTETVRLLNGRRVVVPRSISFDTMPQAEAQAYYDAAFELLAELMETTPAELVSPRSDTSDTAAADAPRG